MFYSWHLVRLGMVLLVGGENFARRSKSANTLRRVPPWEPIFLCNRQEPASGTPRPFPIPQDFFLKIKASVKPSQQEWPSVSSLLRRGLSAKPAGATLGFNFKSVVVDLSEDRKHVKI